MSAHALSIQPAPDLAKVETALLSVSDKTGLVEFAKGLQGLGIRILSTGGTFKALKDAGIAVQDVAAYTGFPEIMDGRVKTLHPKVHGGILARRDIPEHVRAMKDNGIGAIDLVVVNLYPFAATVAKGADFDTCVENIDIGGPAMIRAAAKNHAFVTIVTDARDYKAVLDDLAANKGATSLALRQKLAAAAFAHTAHYDSQIGRWFAAQPGQPEWPAHISFSGSLAQSLRYGENPHQVAALYTDGSNRPGVSSAKQVQGKELSYNNLNDTDAAYELVAEFAEPTVAIIKHANPCGVATAADMVGAYKRALMCDPVSAFGGIIALNRPLDAATAAEILKIFCEVIIAPSINPDVLPLLAKKANVRVLTTDGKLPEPTAPRLTVRTIAGGLLVQSADGGRIERNHLKVATKRAPTEAEMADMLFAFRVAKHVKSNAIVYAKDGATVGIGAGQMSRLDSSRVAAAKMAAVFSDQSLVNSNPSLNTNHSALNTHLVVASDAFFPFADGLIAAADAGVTAVIQPGGSMRDEEVIKAADERGLAMVFTSMRHFRH